MVDLSSFLLLGGRTWRSPKLLIHTKRGHYKTQSGKTLARSCAINLCCCCCCCCCYYAGRLSKTNIDMAYLQNFIQLFLLPELPIQTSHRPCQYDEEVIAKKACYGQSISGAGPVRPMEKAYRRPFPKSSVQRPMLSTPFAQLPLTSCIETIASHAQSKALRLLFACAAHVGHSCKEERHGFYVLSAWTGELQPSRAPCIMRMLFLEADPNSPHTLPTPQPLAAR